MKRLLLLLAVPLALTACVTFDAAAPAGYTGPTVDVADTVVTQSPRLAHVFELSQVEDRRLRSSGIETAAANQGRGLSQQAVTVTHKLPIAPVQVTLAASTQYAAPILAMTNPTCRVEGQVSFKPESGKSYAVRGRITPQQCAVWIEELGSNQPVTAEVTGKGTQ